MENQVPSSLVRNDRGFTERVAQTTAPKAPETALPELSLRGNEEERKPRISFSRAVTAGFCSRGLQPRRLHTPYTPYER